MSHSTFKISNGITVFQIFRWHVLQNFKSQVLQNWLEVKRANGHILCYIITIVKYQGVNKQIGASLNLTSHKAMLGDFMRGEIKQNIGKLRKLKNSYIVKIPVFWVVYILPSFLIFSSISPHVGQISPCMKLFFALCDQKFLEFPPQNWL